MAETASIDTASLNNVSTSDSSSDDISSRKQWLAPVLITVYIVVILLISGLSKTRIEETAGPIGTTAVSDANLK